MHHLFALAGREVPDTPLSCCMFVRLILHTPLMLHGGRHETYPDADYRPERQDVHIVVPSSTRLARCVQDWRRGGFRREHSKRTALHATVQL